MVRRTKEEAEETRLQILDAAERTFHDKGVSRTSLAGIAAAAGVTRGAIYWHFQNKADLFQAMIERLRMPLEELTRATLSEDELDPLGRLRELMVQVLRRVELDTHFRRVSEIFQHKCEFTVEFGDLRQKMQTFSIECDQRIEKSLRNAVNRGQLPRDLDCHLAAFSLHANLGGLKAHWLLTPEHLSLAAQAENLVDGMLDMLRHSPALRQPPST